jgi:hypothetical protein
MSPVEYPAAKLVEVVPVVLVAEQNSVDRREAFQVECGIVVDGQATLTIRDFII